MAKKAVKFSAIRMDVGVVTTAPEFSVEENGKVFGDLRVGLGGAFWRPKGYDQYFKLTWEEVDSLFQRHGAKRDVGKYTIKEPPSASNAEE
jgi:hypothetical protein